MNGDPYSCGEKVETDDCPYKACPADCLVRGVSYHVGDVTKEEGCEVCHCTTLGEKCENDTHAIGMPIISIVSNFTFFTKRDWLF